MIRPALTDGPLAWRSDPVRAQLRAGRRQPAPTWVQLMLAHTGIGASLGVLATVAVVALLLGVTLLVAARRQHRNEARRESGVPSERHRTQGPPEVRN